MLVVFSSPLNFVQYLYQRPMNKTMNQETLISSDHLNQIVQQLVILSHTNENLDQSGKK